MPPLQTAQCWQVLNSYWNGKMMTMKQGKREGRKFLPWTVAIKRDCQILPSKNCENIFLLMTTTQYAMGNSGVKVSKLQLHVCRTDVNCVNL